MPAVSVPLAGSAIVPLAGAAIVALGSLGGAYLQSWYNNKASRQGLKEHRRSEALQIKFANEENRRVESRFSREMGARKGEFEKSFALEKSKAIADQTQNQMDRMMQMFNNNTNLSQQLITNLRGRK